MYTPLSPYLVTDSYGDVTHFYTGGFTDTKASPVEVPDANIHSWTERKNVSAWYMTKVYDILHYTHFSKPKSNTWSCDSSLTLKAARWRPVGGAKPIHTEALAIWLAVVGKHTWAEVVPGANWPAARVLKEGKEGETEGKTTYKIMAWTNATETLKKTYLTSNHNNLIIKYPKLYALF